MEFLFLFLFFPNIYFVNQNNINHYYNYLLNHILQKLLNNYQLLLNILLFFLMVVYFLMEVNSIQMVHYVLLLNCLFLDLKEKILVFFLFWKLNFLLLVLYYFYLILVIKIWKNLKMNLLMILIWNFQFLFHLILILFFFGEGFFHFWLLEILLKIILSIPFTFFTEKK